MAMLSTGAGCSVGGTSEPAFTTVSTFGGVNGDDGGSTTGDGERPTDGDESASSGLPWPTPTTVTSSSTTTTTTTADETDEGSTTLECEGDCIELCFGGDDDDGDGAVDCNDDDCAGHLACTCEVLPDAGFGLHVLCTDPVTWATARDACEDDDMHLVSIDSAAHNTWLADNTQALVLSSWWTGLSDLDVEGVWAWSDETAVTYQHWYPGEPNNGNNGVTPPEHCVAFPEHDGYSWNDLECSDIRPFICTP